MGQDRQQDVLERSKELLVSGLQDNLKSLILYGSHVRGTAVPGRSDYNLLLILEDSNPAAHRVIAEAMDLDPLLQPFIISRADLAGSFRAFGPKFASIRRHYRLLHGEDLLAGFSPDPALSRFLVEQSLRNLKSRIVRAYVREGRRPEVYTRLLRGFASPIYYGLSDLARLLGSELAEDPVQRTAQISSALGRDSSVLRELRELRESRRVLTEAEIEALHASLHGLLKHSIALMGRTWPQ